MAKNGIWSKKKICEIDLFDFTSFFGLDFFNFLAHCGTLVSAFRNCLLLTNNNSQKILFIVRKMVSVMEMPWRYRALEMIQLQFVVNGTDYHLHSMGKVTS